MPVGSFLLESESRGGGGEGGRSIRGDPSRHGGRDELNRNDLLTGEGILEKIQEIFGRIEGHTVKKETDHCQSFLGKNASLPNSGDNQERNPSKVPGVTTRRGDPQRKFNEGE